MSEATSAGLAVVELGEVPYEEALEIQRRAVADRIEGAIADTAFVVEHPPVLTKGRRTEEGELAMGEDWYRAQGIGVVEADRGGRVTYHGPGQSVVYPIVDLRGLSDGRRADVRAFVRALERAMIAALGGAGVPAQVFDGLTGVWTAGRPPIPEGMPGPEGTPVVSCVPELASDESKLARKIGSIGIHVTRGVTSHGLAVNVSNDLQPFEWIVPCGMEAARMTSVAHELRDLGPSREVPTATEFSRAVVAALADQLGQSVAC